MRGQRVGFRLKSGQIAVRDDLAKSLLQPVLRLGMAVELMMSGGGHEHDAGAVEPGVAGVRNRQDTQRQRRLLRVLQQLSVVEAP